MTDSVDTDELRALVASWQIWIEDCDSDEAVARMGPMKAQLEELIEE